MDPTTPTQKILENQELTEKELIEILEKVKEEGKMEARFILELDEWKAITNTYTDTAEIKVLYGEIEKVLKREYKYYDGFRKEYFILPKTGIVILLYNVHYEDEDGKIDTADFLYVFNKDGWKHIRIA